MKTIYDRAREACSVNGSTYGRIITPSRQPSLRVHHVTSGSGVNQNNGGDITEGEEPDLLLALDLLH